MKYWVMKERVEKLLLEYQFEDDMNLLKAVVFTNLVSGILLLTFGNLEVIANFQGQICVLIGLIYLVLYLVFLSY